MNIVKKKKDVLIIEPMGPSANVFSLYSGLPLMGPLYLGTILKAAGHNVSYINENLLGRGVEPLELSADVLILSCLTPTVERGYWLAGEFKRKNPSSLVAIGGPHVSFMPEEALNYCDVVVKGEGENVIRDIVESGVRKSIVLSEPVEDLDALPVVDFAIMKGFKKLKVFPIMTSRGCPHGCNFCSVTAMFGRRYRFQSPERAVEELSRCRQEVCFFYDDNFIANRSRTHKLVDLILRKRSRLPRWLACQTTTTLATDPVLMKKMVRAGFSRVYVGFESISDSALKNFHKHHGASDVIKSVEEFHRYGLRVHGMFIFGDNSDRMEVFEATKRFVKKAKLSTVQFSALTPFPGTKIFEKMKREGRLIHQLWRYYDGLHVVFYPEGMHPLTLQESIISSFDEFYSIVRSAVESIDTLLQCAVRMVRGFSLTRLGVPSFENAVRRLGGKYIVKKWKSLNRNYLKFLRDLPMRTCAPVEKFATC